MPRCMATREPRSRGLTSCTKVKRPGNSRYHGGTDGNKGRKKKRWCEVRCSNCGKVRHVSAGSKSKCSNCGE